MKKFIKFVIILIVIVMLMVLCNTIRNIYIINKIKNNSNQYFSDMKSYKGKVEAYTNFDKNSEDKSLDVQEFYYKDNIYLIRQYTNNQLISTEWKNANTGEQVSNYSEDMQEKFIYTDIMKVDFIIKEEFANSNLKLFLFNFIKTDEENYIIQGRLADFYYNKNNGILSKFYVDDGRYDVYTIEKNSVTDDEVVKPEI